MLERGHGSHIVKRHYFFKNYLLFSGARFRQSKCIVLMTKEEFYQNCQFHDPCGKDSCAKAWPLKS